MHGGHHVAHRFIKTTLPFNECNEMVLPFSSLNFKSGIFCTSDTNGCSPLMPISLLVLLSILFPLIDAYANPVITNNGSNATFLMYVLIMLNYLFYPL